MRDAYFASLILYGCTLWSACTLNTHPQLGASDNPLCIASPSSCDAGTAAPAPTGGSGGQAGTTLPPAGGTGSVVVAGTNAVTSGTTGGMSVPIAGAAGMSLGGMGGTTPPPPPLLEAGKACTADTQCISAHCDGVCCAGGDCCTKVAECKMTTVNGMDLACNDPSTCQGMGGVVECTSDFRCVAKGGAADDRACDAMTRANDCGPYLPVYCNGQIDQTAPACATSCRSDADCDTNLAHCDNRACVMNSPNGSICTRNVECGSKHCSNGFCCDSGDCCLVLPALCPASYSAAATCDPATCQGTSRVATCTNSQCGTTTVMDDSVCTSSVLVNECGAYSNVTCTGTANQQPPRACGTSCTNNQGCDANAFCRNNRCEPKIEDGEQCQANNNCVSNFCGTNNRCCSDTGGQCCTDANQCDDAKFTTSVCSNPATCTGTATGPVCRAKNCVSEPVANANPCGNEPPNNCAPYTMPATATCPATCRTSCMNNMQCAPGNECVGSRCQMAVPMGGMGGSEAGASGTPPLAP
jgi:hypothetical protein